MNTNNELVRQYVERHHRKHGKWAFIIVDSNEIQCRHRGKAAPQGFYGKSVERVSVAWHSTSTSSVVCTWCDYLEDLPRDTVYRDPANVYPTLASAREALIEQINSVIARSESEIADRQAEITKLRSFRRVTAEDDATGAAL